MIDSMIEIVFENLSIKKIGSLLKELTSEGKEVINYNITFDLEDRVKVDWKSENSIEEVFLNDNFGLFVNVNKIIRNNFSLINCGIAAIKYSNTLDLELNFKIADLGKGVLVEDLMEFTKLLSKEYHINNYFCGLEPAQDLSTRLFTNNKIESFGIKFNEILKA